MLFFITVIQIDEFAKAIRDCEDTELQEQCLSSAIDHLSLNYPYIFMLIHKEFEKRKLNANKWTSLVKFSTPYSKTHEALVMTKDTDVMGKEDEYVEKLERFLFEALEYDTDPEVTLKICYELENNAAFTRIYK